MSLDTNLNFTHLNKGDVTTIIFGVLFCTAGRLYRIFWKKSSSNESGTFTDACWRSDVCSDTACNFRNKRSDSVTWENFDSNDLHNSIFHSNTYAASDILSKIDNCYKGFYTDVYWINVCTCVCFFLF